MALAGRPCDCDVLSLNSCALFIATNSYDSGCTSERSATVSEASVRAPLELNAQRRLGYESCCFERHNFPGGEEASTRFRCDEAR